MGSDSRTPSPPGPTNIPHVEKRRLAREHRGMLLDATFSTNLEVPRAPTTPRSLSLELSNQGKDLDREQEHLERCSSKPLGNDLTRAGVKEYVDKRFEYTEKYRDFLRQSRNELARKASEQLVDEPEAKLLRQDIDEADYAVLRERAALANRRAVVEFKMLIGDQSKTLIHGYATAIIGALPEPYGSRLKKDSRNKSDQSDFRSCLIKAYQDDNTDNGRKLWCPVTKKLHNKKYVKAAHIVPYGIGEYNAAKLFGVPLKDGFTKIWNEENGLLLNSEVEEAMDRCRLVIVPDHDVKGALKVKLLTATELELDDLICEGSGGKDVRVRDLQDVQLEFKTLARPGLEYLYVRALVSWLCRRQAAVPGWEKDREIISTGKYWGRPGKWLRNSTIIAIAAEIGDIVDPKDLEDIIGEDEKLEEPTEDDKTLAVALRHNVAALAVRENMLDEDEE
ncbi:uncharacterized protein K452DRAFT_292877 [Aplosporella prunicola CBS 121167]|uniref:HNH nuclease domain-containing protein n=1 Tax=Aplosporella prunicola CBS 121167 TaxID=1176127 RepID=A0A6A6AY39_9PEZI|nr:uncharacterized protein K452DRAFT_292877 [Aplosporella prunicola CBS 121167]KAF2135874.1 hypothetical protein K452DRAFT_292877 [Aplosporella prunicola CBS 121167]